MLWLQAADGAAVNVGNNQLDWALLMIQVLASAAMSGVTTSDKVS
jgi:hypothetical protein